MADYYCKRGERQWGPFSVAAMKQLANSGQLRPGDYVRQENGFDWTPAKAIKGLFTPMASKPPAASTQQSFDGKQLPMAIPLVAPVLDEQSTEDNTAPTSADELYDFILSEDSTKSRKSGIRVKSQSIFDEAMGELKGSVKKGTRTVAKASIKVGVGCGTLFVVFLLMAVLPKIFERSAPTTVEEAKVWIVGGWTAHIHGVSDRLVFDGDGTVKWQAHIEEVGWTEPEKGSWRITVDKDVDTGETCFRVILLEKDGTEHSMGGPLYIFDRSLRIPAANRWDPECQSIFYGRD